MVLAYEPRNIVRAYSINTLFQIFSIAMSVCMGICKSTYYVSHLWCESRLLIWLFYVPAVLHGFGRHIQTVTPEEIIIQLKV